METIVKRVLWSTLALTAAGLACQTAAAQAAASAKPVMLVVPYAPGGAADPILRPMAARLQELWGRPVLIDNRPGANGAIGTQYVINAPGDGNTILFHITGLIQNLALAKTKPSYDPFQDLQPVALIGRQAVALVTPSASAYKTFVELANAVKATPTSFSYGSYGIGSTSHIYGEVLRASLNVDVPHIPFKGTAPLLQEMMGNRIPMAFVSSQTAIDRERDKSLRVVAVTGSQRMERLPEVPTLAELGYKGFEATGWWALFVNSATPRPLAQRMSADIRKVLNEPEMIKRLQDGGTEPSSETPEQFKNNMKTEYLYWESVVRKFNITNE